MLDVWTNELCVILLNSRQQRGLVLVFLLVLLTHTHKLVKLNKHTHMIDM